MRDRNEGVRWREMVEWDSGGMRDLNRSFFPREIRERIKYTGMRQTMEKQDARELGTSWSLKIMGRRPITPAALSAEANICFTYWCSRIWAQSTHMCCWEHYLWYFSHMKGFWTRSIFKNFTLCFIVSLKSFFTSLNSSDEQDKETRSHWALDSIEDQFDGKWLSFAFVFCAGSILSGLPQQKKTRHFIFHYPQDISIIQIPIKRTVVTC